MKAIRAYFEALRLKFFPPEPVTARVVQMEGCPLHTATRFIQDIANWHQVQVIPLKTRKWRNPTTTFGLNGTPKDLDEFLTSFTIINDKIQRPLLDAHQLPPIQWQEQALIWVAHSRAFHRKLLKRPQLFKVLFTLSHALVPLGVLGLIATPWLALHHHVRWDLPLISCLALASGWRLILDLRFVYKAPRESALREMQHRRLT
jgi:hypothetical protein